MTQINNIVPLSHALIRRTAQASGGGTNTGTDTDSDRHAGQTVVTAQAVRKTGDGEDRRIWSAAPDRRKSDRRGTARTGGHTAKITTRYASTFAAQVAGQWYAQSDAGSADTTQHIKTCHAANDAYRSRAGQPCHLVLVDIEN